LSRSGLIFVLAAYLWLAPESARPLYFRTTSNSVVRPSLPVLETSSTLSFAGPGAASAGTRHEPG
jgi:hypothetical protein